MTGSGWLGAKSVSFSLMTQRPSVALLLLLTFCLPEIARAQAQTRERWVGTWGTADTWRPPAAPVATTAPPLAPPAGAAPPASLQASNQTLRQVVRTSVRGDRVRVVLSNVFGTLPITIGSAHVALRDRGAAIVPGSDRTLLFGGRSEATIPAGAVLVSDPVALGVAPLADLAIDLYLPGNTATWSSPLTLHGAAAATSFLSSAGNFAGAAAFPVASTMTSWWLLSRVEVAAARPTRAIVTIGDSITDGTRSTADSNNRWPDELSRRLQSQAATASLAIVNAAIAGNRVLSEQAPNFGINALARFDRDVIAQPGAAYVIVLEGINDIGMGQPETRPSAADLIAAYRQLIDRAHADGLSIFGGTLLPFEGAGYFSAEGEAKRQAVNQWIRTSKAFDGVIDFDAVMRDPAAPTKLRAAYNSGDNLHPNDAGYKAMGQAVDLTLFR